MRLLPLLLVAAVLLGCDSGGDTGSTERGPGGRPRDPCHHLACDTAENVSRPVLVRMAHAAAEALRRLSAQAK